ncbi:putative dynamin-related protein 4A [Capsicum galapagoense]
MSLGFLIDVDDEEEAIAEPRPSDKSVLESIAGIKLPRGEGICTRVPLIMRLQNHRETEVYLEYNGNSVPTDEAHISNVIVLATNEITGHGKGISNISSKLIVKKNGVPDLTMVDLPRITRVAVLEQTKDMLEQISDAVVIWIICGSLNVSVEDNTTGQKNKITITNDKGR